MSLSTTTTTVQEPPAYDDDQYLPTYAESLRGARADGFERSPPKLRRKIRLANYGAASLNGPSDQVTASPALLRRIQNELGQSLVAPPPTWGLEGASEYPQFRLNHGYDYRLRALLWEPSYVELGDVGFIDRRTGAFVKLLNAFNSDVAHCGHLGSLPSVFGVFGFGSLVCVAGVEGGLGSLTLHWLAWRARRAVWRGAKEAVVITEDDCFRYLNNTDRPQNWFHRSIDKIIAAYGPTYGLKREEIIFGENYRTRISSLA
ncbi:hypothetical protein EXIGLDRAFT_767490 [Exidia glandulosa HHB12029]|uniref:Uncharacterized protein n=1 Tax=Exidia glandulosa HHB12029 TaxID=1314781 RepID=A0A165IYQ5_EXIGL|nr:hypothetical protein EXIGLDRAFT_767490 [Exidia glandulosa HHB12029]